ncbi:MAG TPA: polysaccharide deacetylase family protein [Candidatus Aquicultor sp.]|jgi:peptidoglycan/xylan/chitin deacetylase (PgdA/CDA1 family)
MGMRKPIQLATSAIVLSLIGIFAIAILRSPEFWEWFRDADALNLLIGGIFLLIPIVAAMVSYYEYHGIGCQDGIMRRGPHENVIAITFDDGPNPIYTPKILDVLKEKGVKATFFVVGCHVKKYPEVAKRIVDEGHDIGNHTYTHKDMVPSTRRMVLAQTRKTNHIIEQVTGANTKLFRPPRGIYSTAVRKVIVDEEGYNLILWTVSSVDWRGLSPQRILRRITRFARPGAILLFHDSGALVRREGASRENTVESLGLVIDHLHARGFEIIPISEMLRRLEEQEMETSGILTQA